jgi:hypothetical protein
MAIFLFKFIRRKIGENATKKTVPTTEDSHLVPEVTPGQQQPQTLEQNREHGAINPRVSSNSYVDQTSAEDATLRKAEARKRNIRQIKLMLGLALPNFLAFIDVTIVAPAIPLISSHFSMLYHSSFFLKKKTIVLIQLSRSPLRQFQLDRRCLHPDIHRICPSLRTICRHIRAPLRTPIRNVLDPDRQRSVCCCSVVGDASPRPGTARLGRCRHHEFESYHIV